MLHFQKLMTGLALLFLVAGLVAALTVKSPTAAVTARIENPQSAQVFCYESYLCQSGIECMYLGNKEPFCSQPTIQAEGITQQYGIPCQLQNDKVVCPLTR